jgi:hypothetical protein
VRLSLPMPVYLFYYVWSVLSLSLVWVLQLTPHMKAISMPIKIDLAQVRNDHLVRDDF